jgi:hypothetical protein
MLQNACMSTTHATISVGEDHRKTTVIQFHRITQPSSVSLNIELTILATDQVMTAVFPFVDL